MKPPPFAYSRPRRLDEALELMSLHASDAKPLAGGQSLVPLLNMRLARPLHLVDLNRVPELAGIRSVDGQLRIGAMTRQRAVEQHPTVRQEVAVLAEAVSQVGHVQIRNRGTLGGSLAHADPSAELPLAVVLLRGEMVIASVHGQRTMSADGFFLNYLTTALEADELTQEALVGQRADRERVAGAVRAGVAELRPDDDAHASAQYRRRVAEALVTGVILQAVDRAGYAA